jgi:hypothetical protein
LLADDVVALSINKVLVLLWSQVQVLKSSFRAVGILPSNGEVRHELLSKTDTSTGVGRQVDTWNSQLTCELRALVEELVFLRTE